MISQPALEYLPPEAAVPTKAGRSFTTLDLSEDQAEAFNQIVGWLSAPYQTLTLGGLAGTGKTTIIAILATYLTSQWKIAFTAFTGKAANVMRQKLLRSGVALDAHYCGTIHGLIYDPVVDPVTEQVLGWQRKPGIGRHLIVVDEASMVSHEIWKDLTSYECKVLAIGDHGQLPPIGSDKINLMSAPQLRLERIHRQAKENSIVQYANAVRLGEPGTRFEGNDGRVRIRQAVPNVETAVTEALDPSVSDLDQAVLCYTNKMRVKLNRAIATDLGRGDNYTVSAEQTVVCLRNTRVGSMNVWNGMRGTLESVSTVNNRHLLASIAFSDDCLRLRGTLCAPQFGREKTYDRPETYAEEMDMRTAKWSDMGLLFDHGWALTCHKAQGSQYSHVIVVLEDGPWFWKNPGHRSQWLYTAATRAVDRLTIIV